MVPLIYSNTANFLMLQGGGQHGHICIIMNPTLYTILSNMAWVKPPEPEVYLTVPMKSTTSNQDKMK